MSTSKLAILGCGNIGSAIAKGLVKSGMSATDISLTRRKTESLSELNQTGFHTSVDNTNTVQNFLLLLLWLIFCPCLTYFYFLQMLEN